jgi:hypothetical protein
MNLWIPMVAWGVVKVACALIEWRARIGYERAHAASVADVLRAVSAGIVLQDRRADGAVLIVQPEPAVNRGIAVRDMAGGILAEQH